MTVKKIKAISFRNATFKISKISKKNALEHRARGTY